MITRTQTKYSPVRKDGQWVFPDGRILPIVSGGDPTATPPGEDPAAPGTVTVSSPPADPPAERTFTAAEVEEIRKQEKNKLYGDLEKLGEQNKELSNRLEEMGKNVEAFNADRQAQLQQQEAEREAAEQERKAREEAEMDAKALIQRRETEFEERLNSINSEWSEKFEQLQQQAASQEALWEKERAFAANEAYKQSKLAENSDDIIPHLAELVTGNTPEEIDAAIERARAMTSAIMEDMSQAVATQRPRGVPTTGASPTGPMENHLTQQNLTADDIRNMSMEKFAELRPQLLQQARPS